MPPRKRIEKSEGTQKDATASNESSSPTIKAQESSAPAENREGWMTFQPTRYRKRSGGVRWFPVVKRLFYVSLLVLVPMILNYAALNHELRVLPPKGIV